MQVGTRGRALLAVVWAALLACDRGPTVEALPLPDAEPPVVIIGPGRDSGDGTKASKKTSTPKASASGKPDAAVSPKPDAAVSSGRDAALASKTPVLPDIPQRSVAPVDDDGVPTYVLDESAAAAAERAAAERAAAGRASPTPSRSASAPASTPPPPAPSPSPSAGRTIAPAGSVTSGAKGPLVLVDGRTGRIDVMSREAALLGRIDMGNAIVRGVAHDRRSGDGVWILVAGSPPMIAKIGWDGRRMKGFEVRRPPMRRARAFVGIDHIMGRTASSDLILVMYVNKLGLPVVEGILVRDGTSRFSVGFSREADVAGVRAEGFRHDDVDGLLVMDWWTIRAGNHLERWRFFYGFVDRLEDRPMKARIDAFDIPPWREVWGADRSGHRVVRMSGDGDIVQSYPAPDLEPAFVAISP